MAEEVIPGVGVGTHSTLIIGQEVKSGSEAVFESLLNELHASAAGSPGCLGTESAPPSGVQKEWVSTYHFDSIAHLQAWLNSSQRQKLITRLGELQLGPATQQVIAGEKPSANPELVTVVVTHGVPPGAEAEFQAWQRRMTEAEQQFDGFRGAELFQPVPGVQHEWTAIYRFESGAALEAWLASPERAQVLAEGEKFEDFQLRTIQSPFGSWFNSVEEQPEGPSDFKTSMAVWVGLYPTVMFLTLAIDELVPGAELWQALLVGNLLSSFIMTYVTMPQYVNRLLRFWLTADEDTAPPHTSARGIALAVGTVVLWAAVFWLTTTVIWNLP